MSFTRFHDDPCRINKQLQQQTDPGRWILETPGNGVSPDYIIDPFIHLQKWGANLWTNSTDVESSFLGLGRTLNRDNPNDNKSIKLNFITNNKKNSYNSTKEFLRTEQSRSILPAWVLRDNIVKDDINKDILLYNPQDHCNTLIPFESYTDTRILNKKYYEEMNKK